MKLGIHRLHNFVRDMTSTKTSATAAHEYISHGNPLKTLVLPIRLDVQRDFRFSAAAGQDYPEARCSLQQRG